jgi:hypothetical protein
MTRLCPCGAPVTPQTGKGPPFRYCEQHAPARRAYMTAYLKANLPHLREADRARHGYRPLVSFTCGHCGQPSRSYIGDTTLCHRCRQLVEAHRHEPTDQGDTR